MKLRHHCYCWKCHWWQSCLYQFLSELVQGSRLYKSKKHSQLKENPNSAVIQEKQLSDGNSFQLNDGKSCLRYNLKNIWELLLKYQRENNWNYFHHHAAKESYLIIAEYSLKSTYAFQISSYNVYIQIHTHIYYSFFCHKY